jgi:predicted nuclease of predicted toxin-antitoxin system
MRLLFDEQLSNRLPGLLADCYPDSLHIESLDLGGAPDVIVWQTAVVHRCVLVSKDEDFHRLSVMHGAPPKVVWLRLGNCTTQDIVDLLRKHLEDVRQFDIQDEVSVLELGGRRVD